LQTRAARYFAFLLSVVVGVGAAVPAALAADAKEVVGWIESVRLSPGDVEVKAKLDTGAKMSSLSCNCLTPFERNGEKWIRFSVEGKDGTLASFERRVVGRIKIKRHFGHVQERPVVTLGICLGGVYKLARVNLIDRSGFRYPMLIGRNELQQHFIVDPELSFRSQPRCQGAHEVE